jgi:hypothetical protein
MSAADDVDQLIVKGNPLALQEALKKLFLQREEVTLNYPLSPPARGWEEAAAQFDTVSAAAEGCDALVATGVTPTLRPAPGLPEWRAAPRRCARKFVAFVKYVTTLCPPAAATSESRLA